MKIRSQIGMDVVETTLPRPAIPFIHTNPDKA